MKLTLIWDTRLGRAILVAGAVLLSFAAHVGAQTVLPTSYELRFFTVGGTTPVASSALPSTAYACNVDPAAPFQAGVPTAYWDDPGAAGRQCRYADPGTGGFVTSPPNVTVDVALAACVVQDGAIRCTAESNRVQYTRRVLPGVPGGFGVRPPEGVSASGIVLDRYGFAGLDVALVSLDVGGQLYVGASTLAVPGFAIRRGDRAAFTFYR